jgi:hypothetical protein
MHDIAALQVGNVKGKCRYPGQRFWELCSEWLFFLGCFIWLNYPLHITILGVLSSGKVNVSKNLASFSMALEFVQLQAHFSFRNGQELPARFPFCNWRELQQPFFISQWAWVTMAIFLFLQWVGVTRTIFIKSFEIFSLHGHTTLHYDCSIIADLLKRRMTGMSYPLRFILIIILACTAIQGSAMSQIHAWRTLCWPLGGGRTSVVVAA